jgi:hypothetical protein
LDRGDGYGRIEEGRKEEMGRKLGMGLRGWNKNELMQCYK